MNDTDLRPLNALDVEAMAWMLQAVADLAKVRALFDYDEPVRTCIIRGFDPIGDRARDIRLRGIVLYDVYRCAEFTRTFGELAELRQRGLVGRAG